MRVHIPLRLSTAVFVSIIVVGLAPGTYGAVSGDASASGLEIIGPDAIQFRPSNEAQAIAFDEALTEAMNARDHFAYPWVDQETNSLDIRVTDDVGRGAAEANRETFAEAGWVTNVTDAKTSIAQLDAIAEDATHLISAGLPNADLVWKAEPDYKNNRIILTISQLDAELTAALAKRFGSDLIALRIAEGGKASSGSRDSDGPPFWGGALISTSTGKVCTTGFSWAVGNQSAMLTAAHCISTTGTVSYPNHLNAGTVTAFTGENWNDVQGTQLYTGQSVFRGDVALIRYTTLSSGGRIYSGAPGTGTNAAVGEMASRKAQLGDSACNNGRITGPWCGVVTLVGVNIWYAGDGPNVWARNVTEADAPGWTCPTHGDSGAPVYRTRTDGKVVALGIFSGDLPLVAACETFFTDIRDSWQGLPGNLKTT